MNVRRIPIWNFVKSRKLASSKEYWQDWYIMTHDCLSYQENGWHEWVLSYCTQAYSMYIGVVHIFAWKCGIFVIAGKATYVQYVICNLAVFGYHLFFHYFRTRTVRPTLYGAFLPRKWASRKIRAYALIFRNPVHVRFCLFQNFQRKKWFFKLQARKETLPFSRGFFSSLELKKSFFPKPLLNDVFHVFSWNIEASLSHKWNFTWQHQHGLWHEVFVFRDKK